jgi:hypothetical protein
MHFFVNYPPPPMPSRESIINEGLKSLEQPKTDQLWLKNWIERKKEQKELSSNSISLSNYRQKLVQHAHLLQEYEHALTDCNLEILFELKTKIEQSNHIIYDCNITQNIQKQIHRRKSKRARLRRRKEIKVIDIKTDIIQAQLTNDKTLTEKIQEINSILQTIEQLKQLKTTRQQRQKDNSIDTNEDELTEIQNQCTAKLHEYQIEMEGASRSCHTELCNYLFDDHDRSFYESIDPDAHYLLRAHQNTHNLIQIRQAWDQYSSTHISSLDNIIPSQWVEPQAPSDSNWAQYIFNKKE